MKKFPLSLVSVVINLLTLIDNGNARYLEVRQRHFEDC